MSGPGDNTQDGPTPSKHRRGYQACVECRQSKVKCDLGDPDKPSDPPCRRCQRTGRNCVLVGSYNRKGSMIPHESHGMMGVGGGGSGRGSAAHSRHTSPNRFEPPANPQRQYQQPQHARPNSHSHPHSHSHSHSHAGGPGPSTEAARMGRVSSARTSMVSPSMPSFPNRYVPSFKLAYADAGNRLTSQKKPRSDPSRQYLPTPDRTDRAPTS